MARIVEERDLTEHTLAVSAGTPTRAKAHEAGTSGGDALLKTILASLEDDKAEDVVTIPLAGKSQMADHMVVASGRSSRQVGAMAEHLADTLKRDSGMICRTEGKDLGDWVLIDAGDVIVHLFRPEVREFYQLEKMWLPAGGAAPKAADTV